MLPPRYGETVTADRAGSGGTPLVELTYRFDDGARRPSPSPPDPGRPFGWSALSGEAGARDTLATPPGRPGWRLLAAASIGPPFSARRDPCARLCRASSGATGGWLLSSPSRASWFIGLHPASRWNFPSPSASSFACSAWRSRSWADRGGDAWCSHFWDGLPQPLPGPFVDRDSNGHVPQRPRAMQ